MASSDFSNSKLPEKLPVVRQTAGFAFVRQEGPDKIVDVFGLIVASLLTKNGVSNFSDGRDINHHTYQHWYQIIFAASTSRHKRNIIDMNYVLESS